jgi:phage gp46-like protein
MADIQTVWSPSLGVGDWYFAVAKDGVITDENGFDILDSLDAPINDSLFGTASDLTVGNDLGTAVMISLFTDATAGADDVIPDGSGDPRGWWGDEGEDRPIGSKLWLLTRSKQTATVLALAKAYIEQALQWLIDDGVATSVGVATEWSRPGFLGGMVEISRSSGPRAAVRFDWAWKELN